MRVMRMVGMVAAALGMFLSLTPARAQWEDKATAPSDEAAVTSPPQNRLYAIATGAFAFVIVDNFDADNDGVPDRQFFFTHYQVGSFHGVPEKKRYERQNRRISHEGAIVNRAGLRFETAYYATGTEENWGGYYELGNATLRIYADANGSKRYEPGERIYVNIRETSPLRINGASYEFDPEAK